MKKAGRFCLKCMGRFEEYVSMIMMAVTLLVTVLNVFARYVLRNSLPWSQEVSGIAWTWAVMLGISWAYRSNLHMGIDLLVQKVGPRLKRVLFIITYVILTVAFVFMLYMSIEITLKGGYKLTNYFKLPYWVKYISAVIAFFNMTVYSLRFIFYAVREPAKFVECVSINGSGLDDFDKETGKGAETA